VDRKQQDPEREPQIQFNVCFWHEAPLFEKLISTRCEPVHIPALPSVITDQA
jgi:hypothetical protein